MRAVLAPPASPAVHLWQRPSLGSRPHQLAAQNDSLLGCLLNAAAPLLQQAQQLSLLIGWPVDHTCSSLLAHARLLRGQQRRRLRQRRALQLLPAVMLGALLLQVPQAVRHREKGVRPLP